MFSITKKLTSIFTDIADAIRLKTGTSEPIKVKNFISHLTLYEDRITNILEGKESECSDQEILNAFSNCTQIRPYLYLAFNYNYSVLNMPNCLTIGVSAFKYSPAETIILPKCTTINYAAFQSCSVKTLNLENCLNIYSNAFAECTNLDTIYLYGSNICNMASTNIFRSTPIASGKGSIFVPASLVDSYKTANRWSTYASIIYSINNNQEE